MPVGRNNCGCTFRDRHRAFKCMCHCHVRRWSTGARKAARTKLRNRVIHDTQHALGDATWEEAVAWLIADWRLRGVEMPEGFVEAQ